LAWIDAALTSARPQVLGALLRYFRDLDTAEEAFQDACLRALRNWPQNGPPREPAAWLIMVGRNVAIDQVRRRNKQEALPPEEVISDLDDAEAEMVERLDGEHYRDDILRLLFICCHPDLPATQQIALALRIVSGMSVKQIARAFLAGESAMEQRITRAKSRVARADVPFETPGAVERAERLAAVAAMIYLIFNEGYSASGAADMRAPLCEEAIRLARLLLRLFPSEPEIMGLLALLLVQHARAPARFDADGSIVLLEDQDRDLWNRTMIAEGLASSTRRCATAAVVPCRCRPRSRRCMRGLPGRKTPTGRRSICSTPRSRPCSRRRSSRSTGQSPSPRSAVRPRLWPWSSRWRRSCPAISTSSA
jgi:RNA polymerase sigma-70 factor (ECF subfamily)